MVLSPLQSSFNYPRILSILKFLNLGIATKKGDPFRIAFFKMALNQNQF